jgi:hypothetical protein
MLYGEIHQGHDESAFGPGGLEEALSARLALEGFDFEIERQEGGLQVAVRSCPWHQIMIKSGRAALSERVSDVICRVENETWAQEFSGPEEEIGFERERRGCAGGMRCAGCGLKGGSQRAEPKLNAERGICFAQLYYKNSENSSVSTLASFKMLFKVC